MFRFLTGLLVAVTVILTPAYCTTKPPPRYDDETPRLGLTTEMLPPPHARPATNTRNDYFINLDTVKKIVCLSFPKGVTIESDPTKLTPAQLEQVHMGSGTVTVIGKNRVLTAHHVIASESTGDTACFVDGKLTKTVYDNPTLDVSVLEVPLGNTAVTQIGCDGFIKDRAYFMIGYAWGTDFAMQEGIFNGSYGDIGAEDPDGSQRHVMPHVAEFDGAVFPGMSGGPVIGVDGRIYGIINAGGEHDSIFRDLKDTPLCAALAEPTPAAAPDKPIVTAKP
jgi:S1-C subfamily serine protease